MPDSLSRTFSTFLSNLTYDALPPEVVDKIKGFPASCSGGLFGGSGNPSRKSCHQLGQSRRKQPCGGDYPGRWEPGEPLRSGLCQQQADARNQPVRLVPDVDSSRPMRHSFRAGHCRAWGKHRERVPYRDGGGLRGGGAHRRRFHPVHPSPGFSVQPGVRNAGRRSRYRKGFCGSPKTVWSLP